jgi:hypothetical protein
VRFYDTRLDDHVQPFIRPLASPSPLELDKRDGGSEPLFRVCLRARHVQLAQLLESLTRTLCDAGRDRFEISVVRQEDGVTILRNLGDDRVRRVSR